MTLDDEMLAQFLLKERGAEQQSDRAAQGPAGGEVPPAVPFVAATITRIARRDGRSRDPDVPDSRTAAGLSELISAARARRQGSTR
jgi:hypothetical protein